MAPPSLSRHPSQRFKLGWECCSELSSSFRAVPIPQTGRGRSSWLNPGTGNIIIIISEFLLEIPFGLSQALPGFNVFFRINLRLRLNDNPFNISYSSSQLILSLLDQLGYQTVCRLHICGQFFKGGLTMPNIIWAGVLMSNRNSWKKIQLALRERHVQSLAETFRTTIPQRLVICCWGKCPQGLKDHFQSPRDCPDPSPNPTSMLFSLHPAFMLSRSFWFSYVGEKFPSLDLI